MQYDYIAFIGRFQPFHNGHLEACKQALQQGKHLVIFLGSMFMAPNIRHPIPFQSRKDIIAQALDEAGYQGRYTIFGIRDYFYSANDSLWITQIQKLMVGVTGSNKNIALMGHKKDSTSYYIGVLEKTLGWKFIPADTDSVIDATIVREAWFDQNTIRKDLVPSPVANFLTSFDAGELQRLRNEFEEVKDIKYRHKMAEEQFGIYPRIDQATDAIITCAGHVLLGERKGKIGYGQVAFPGGFVHDDEKLLNACLRELREETKLRVPTGVLKGAIKKTQTYDHELRSVRGRVITRVFHIDLIDRELPQVKANDDFKKAYWKPIYWLQENPELVFEDHWEIFEDLIGF